jgi:hypothetical protein
MGGGNGQQIGEHPRSDQPPAGRDEATPVSVWPWRGTTHDQEGYRISPQPALRRSWIPGFWPLLVGHAL